MEDNNNKVVILVTSDNILPLTEQHNLYYDGTSYYKNPQGLYQKMLESEKGNQHLFTRVSPEEASLNNWPVVDLSSAERPFNAGIAKKNVNVYSAISNYMNKYNLDYKDAVDLYNTEILYAKLFEKYSEEYGKGNIFNPYKANMGVPYSDTFLTNSISALEWENHKDSYIDELAGMWDKICRYKGDHKNGIGLDKSKKYVQDLFNYKVLRLIQLEKELLEHYALSQGYIYDATKRREYENMRNMFNSALLVNDGYKTWMNQLDPTTPEGLARMDQLYSDGMALYKPLSDIGHGVLFGLYPLQTILGLGAGYLGGKATDEVVKATTDYDSWADLAQDKWDMLPADAETSNPGTWIAAILGTKAGTKAQRAVNNYRVASAIDNAVATAELPKEYTIVQTLSSPRNPHPLYRTTPANISKAEMAGKSRGVRNQNKSWADNFMGVVKRVPHPNHRWLREIPQPGVLVPFEDNPNFGAFLGHGLELVAYLSGPGNNYIIEYGLSLKQPTVYKMPSGSFFNNTVDKATGRVLKGQALDFPTLEDIRVYNLKVPAVHNQVPGALKLKLVGYTWSPPEVINGLYHPASFHPVFELGIAVPQRNLPRHLSSRISSDLYDIFTKKGWYYGGNLALKGPLTVNDLHDANIGMDLNGLSVIMDPGFNFSAPWKIGKETSFPHRFNLKASDINFDSNVSLKNLTRNPKIYDSFNTQISSAASPTVQPLSYMVPGGPVPSRLRLALAAPKPSIITKPVVVPKTVVNTPLNTTLLNARLAKFKSKAIQKLQSYLNKNNITVNSISLPF